MSEEDARNRERIAIIAFSSVLLVAMVIAVTIGVNNIQNDSDNEIEDNRKNHVTSTIKAVQTLCDPAGYKKECEENLIAEAGDTKDPRELIKIAFNVTIKKIGDKLMETELLHEVEKEPRAKMALGTCKQLLDLSIEELTRSFDGIEEFDLKNINKILMNVKVWLTGAITYQDTCLDGFQNTTSDAGKKMKELLKTSMHMSSNALAIVTDLAETVSKANIPKLLGRHLLQYSSETPSWVGHRALLDVDKITLRHKPNVTVALDGNGDFKSINKALKKVPEKSKMPFVIFIKEGLYHEYVEVAYQMDHVVFVGDGGNKTRIVGNKNFMDGINTYRTATVAVQGDHFVAINMGFENSAGPQKHQAVALRVQGDKAIFYNCSMDGHQDTLYVHAMRQFYRNCTISGTVDFVFGNALAVFQNCTFVVRKPIENQRCIVTAQGRTERQQPSAIVIQGGSIEAGPEFHTLKHEKKAYLARPWKNYSRTIIMDTYIDDLIHPDGYLPWQGQEGPSGMGTCFYAEYRNSGPGSDKTKRVKWSGIRNLNSRSALWFSPSKFFHGSDWIEITGIPYLPGIREHHKHKKTNWRWRF